MTIYELSAIFFLLIILAWRIISGGFSMEQDVERASDSKRRKESFKYVLAKSQDIIFQDVLQVIVLSALFFYTGSVSTTVIIFSAYFFVGHLLLLFHLPRKLALFFSAYSLAAAIVFSVIFLFGIGIVYIFVAHWLFYVFAYRTIQKLYTLDTLSGKVVKDAF